LEKAIEIKRRAQRFIQGGNLEGALKEYEKLVTLEDCDPYNFVLLADLLYKRGDTQGAVDRYLLAAKQYEENGLSKNAIAVCKKMMRLALAPSQVLERLAHLSALDGLGTEASLYYQQFAEHLVRDRHHARAATALRKAFEASPEETGLLERIAELHLEAGERDAAASALAEASAHYGKRGWPERSAECRERAEGLKPGVTTAAGAPAPSAEVPPPAGDEAPSPGPTPASAEQEHGTEPRSPSAGAAPEALPQQDGDEPVAAAEGERSRTGSKTAAGTSGTGSDLEDSARPSGREVGLRFDAPALAGRPAIPESALLSAGEIETMLHRAQELMRSGDHAGASGILIGAARAYEAVGRLDNAVTIYRSIARSAPSPAEVLTLWLANAERRGERQEAAEVACELGDHTLQRGDRAGAREWFERALGFDPNSAHAQRRLQRLTEGQGAGEAVAPRQIPIDAAAGAWAPTPVSPSPPPSEIPGVAAESAPAAAGSAAAAVSGDRVEMALGRSEAVSFDLGAMLAEFQRGIESQLSGDAQGHYDLAMAYREMGLLDHAVESFRMAMSNPALTGRASEMLGRCLLDQGRFDDTIRELSEAVERPGVDEEATRSMHYLLGLAFEAAGRSGEALKEFERVFALQPNFQDVAQKLRDLRKLGEVA
jgi:tetratricopeptide (TPR) repeat protein